MNLSDNEKIIIVLGASGDTGKYFVNYFLEECKNDSYKIIATGTRKTDYFEKIGVEYYQVDITKKEDFNKLPTKVYAVVDLAGAMPARMKGYNPYKYIDVNITGNLKIMEKTILFLQLIYHANLVSQAIIRFML